MNILIADDEVAIRELVGELLESEGYDVTLAEDGEDALNKFKRTWHEIVFSDFRMPKMSGIELLGAVKKINENTRHRQQIEAVFQSSPFRWISKQRRCSEIRNRAVVLLHSGRRALRLSF